MVDSILGLNSLRVQIELVKIIEKDDLNTYVKVPNVHLIYHVFVKDRVYVIRVWEEKDSFRIINVAKDIEVSFGADVEVVIVLNGKDRINSKDQRKIHQAKVDLV